MLEGEGRTNRPCLDFTDFEAFFAISCESKEMKKEATGGHG